MNYIFNLSVLFTMFKQDFKYYKSRKPAPSFENVLNLKHPTNHKVSLDD